jgi:MFS-type transporter involved in bile tolerance (Atg22 family)
MKSKEATFFGLFWAINQSSMIIGSALGALIFSLYDT